MEEFLPVTDLKQWINNETITARDYVYERDTIVNALNALYYNALDLANQAFTRIWVQADEPTEATDVDIWYKIIT
jgi:hypothetical protein